MRGNIKDGFICEISEMLIFCFFEPSSLGGFGVYCSAGFDPENLPIGFESIRLRRLLQFADEHRQALNGIT
jgi:hypothetical protein